MKLSMFLVEGSNSSESWLDKVRSFASAACRMPAFTGHTGLVEVVLKYRMQQAGPFVKVCVHHCNLKCYPPILLV